MNRDSVIYENNGVKIYVDQNQEIRAKFRSWLKEWDVAVPGLTLDQWNFVEFDIDPEGETVKGGVGKDGGGWGVLGSGRFKQRDSEFLKFHMGVRLLSLYHGIFSLDIANVFNSFNNPTPLTPYLRPPRLIIQKS